MCFFSLPLFTFLYLCVCQSRPLKRHGGDQAAAGPVRQQQRAPLPHPGWGGGRRHAGHEPAGRRQADSQLSRGQSQTRHRPVCR